MQACTLLISLVSLLLFVNLLFSENSIIIFSSFGFIVRKCLIKMVLISLYIGVRYNCAMAADNLALPDLGCCKVFF